MEKKYLTAIMTVLTLTLVLSCLSGCRHDVDDHSSETASENSSQDEDVSSALSADEPAISPASSQSAGSSVAQSAVSSQEQASSSSQQQSNASSSATSGPGKKKIVERDISVPANGLYDIIINIPLPLDPSEDWAGIIWQAGDSFTMPAEVSWPENNKTILGTAYLPKGLNTIRINHEDNSLLPSAFDKAIIEIRSARIYQQVRLDISKEWMISLFEPTYKGWIETTGWDDMWTACQYLPEKFIAADLLGNSQLRTIAKTAADEFLIKKMLMDDGSVHTVYKAAIDEYEKSIEPDMQKNVWDLWRGNAAFIEEMINCYKEFKDEKYLLYAKKASDYVLTKWPTVTIPNGAEIYTNLTNGSDPRVESIGRIAMVFCQMYEITKEQKYLVAAIEQGKGILYSQNAETGLFRSQVTYGWEHGNAFSNAILGLSWLYRETKNSAYMNAVDKGVKALSDATTDDYGAMSLGGNSAPDGISMYLNGRMAQGVFTAAYLTSKTSYYRAAEKLLFYVFGRNAALRDNQDKYLGSFYYGIIYYGPSNVETSSEINLAIMQLEFLRKYWPK